MNDTKVHYKYVLYLHVNLIYHINKVFFTFLKEFWGEGQEEIPQN